jgi:adenosylhomocysteine nucleosidase
MSSAAKPRPVFIAALNREIAGLVHGWRGDENLPGRGIHLYWNDEAVVACAGMGADRAVLAVEAALALGPVSELVSVGWAGACHSQFRAGDVIHADIVVDAKTGERFFSARERGEPEPQKIVVTVAAPAGVKEKERLAVAYYACAVEMEAAAVGRLARIRELPFYAIKAISDDASFEMPDMAKFSAPNGQFREGAFGLHVALRPSLWKPVLIMAKGSKLAAGRLQNEIEAHIGRQGKRKL